MDAAPVNYSRGRAPSPESQMPTPARPIKAEVSFNTGQRGTTEQAEAAPESRQQGYVYFDPPKTDTTGIVFEYPVQEPLRADDAEWLERMFRAIYTERYNLRQFLADVKSQAAWVTLELELARAEMRDEKEKMNKAVERLCQVMGPKRAKMILVEIEKSTAILEEMQREEEGATANGGNNDKDVHKETEQMATEEDADDGFDEAQL